MNETKFQELVELARIRCSNMSDFQIQICHTLAASEWVKLGQYLQMMRDATDSMAGLVAQLEPTPVPKLEIKRLKTT